MKGDGVGRAHRKPPTLQPRTNNREVGCGLQTGDNSTEATYMPDTFGKLEIALEDAKRTLEQEKMLIPDVEEEEDNNPNPVVRYAIADETNRTSRNKKKTKSNKDDRLVEAIKRALGEENSVTNDSHTQFSRDASSFYTDDELINNASSTMSGSSYTDVSNCSVDEGTTLDATLLSGFTGVTSSSAPSGSFADDYEKDLKGRRYSQRKDEGTLDDANLDEGTMLSGYTEDTPMTSSVTADFQSPFMCTSSPKKHARTQRRDRGRTDESVLSEPDYLEDEDDYYDDDISHDNTYATRGTVGVVQDILSCGTYSCCFGNNKKYQPRGDFTVGTKETRSTDGSSVTPLTVKERLNRTRSKMSLEDDATEVTVKKVNTKEGAIFVEEDANVVAETLDNIFWKGDGVFSDESSVATGLTPVGAHLETSETIEMTNEGVDAAVLHSASVQSKSLQKTDNINDLLNQDPHLKPNQISFGTSDTSIASSTKKKKKPYMLSAARSFGKSLSFRRQKSSATQQLQGEVDVDDGRTITTLPSIDNIGTVQATGPQNLQRGRSTTSQSKSQGYEVPRKKTFRQMMRSRSRHRIIKHSSIAASPTSPARTVNTSVSTDSTSTDPELSAIAANEWRSTIDKSTGKTYFYNKMTKEVRWEAPEGFFEEQKSSPPEWKAAYDATTGRTYYYNRKTKEVTWKKPYDVVAS